MRRRFANPADLHAARVSLAAFGLAFGLYLAHVARLDVRLGLGRGEIEGEAFLAEPVPPAIVSLRGGWDRHGPVLWITAANGRRFDFRYWDDGTWHSLVTAAEEKGAEAHSGLGWRVWKAPPPTVGGEREVRAWDRFVLRVRYAGLGRRVITGFEVQ